tara:strand:+ start:39807 stop:39974 length:168 start_codon:yes stop_codon:yes gene_type:complete
MKEVVIKQVYYEWYPQIPKRHGSRKKPSFERDNSKRIVSKRRRMQGKREIQNYED